MLLLELCQLIIEAGSPRLFRLFHSAACFWLSSTALLAALSLLLAAEFLRRQYDRLLVRRLREPLIQDEFDEHAFYKGRSLTSISTDDVYEFIQQRRSEDESGNAIINRSNALLRRMLILAHKRGIKGVKLHEVPDVPMLEEPPPRQGFLEPERFAELKGAMPENLKTTLHYLYFTGCRTGAAKKVEWTQVLFDGNRVELLFRANQVKNKRAITLALPDEVAEAIRKVPVKRRSGPVFCMTNLTKAFKKACVAVGLGSWRDPKNHDAGYDGLLLHDLRRSGVRNLRKAGVPEDVAMKVSGHRTRSVFTRYDIVDTDDLHDAMQRVSAYVRSKTASAN